MWPVLLSLHFCHFCPELKKKIRKSVDTLPPLTPFLCSPLPAILVTPSSPPLCTKKMRARIKEDKPHEEQRRDAAMRYAKIPYPRLSCLWNCPRPFLPPCVHRQAGHRTSRLDYLVLFFCSSFLVFSFLGASTLSPIFYTTSPQKKDVGEAPLCVHQLNELHKRITP